MKNAYAAARSSIFLLLCAIVLRLCLLAPTALAAGAATDNSRAQSGAPADTTRVQASTQADSVRTQTTAQPALWAKAVEILNASKDLVPGQASQKTQELDDKGRVKSQTDVEISIALDSLGEIKSEIIQATKDGKDITAAERKRAEERDKKEAQRKGAKKETDSDEHSHSFSTNDGPFNVKRQPDLRIAESTTRATIDSAQCIQYEFSYPEKREARSKSKPTMVKGIAWVEESSGRPIKVEYTFDPLPKHVKRMRTILRYGAEANDAWILKEMEFEARGSFLFIGKSIRGDILFRDYWKYEGSDQ